MNIDEAKTILDACDRIEELDPVFKDVNVTWEKEGLIVATGFFGVLSTDVWIAEIEGREKGIFRGVNALPLRERGTFTRRV